MITSTQALLVGILAGFLYSLVKFLRPLLALSTHISRARQIGLPFKVIPFPQGLFSFFAFQVLRRLRLMQPGTKLHRLLNMGRPDGYELHEEMGDVFVTVNPMGLGLIIADPKVANQVNSRRTEFPKPPNTGAIINLYGRNVINTDGEQWRFHRRVTGPVFSERIHSAVWREGTRQVGLMMDSWILSQTTDGKKINALHVQNLHADALHLALNVITGSAYGTPLEWAQSPPFSSDHPAPRLSYHASVEQLNLHLMSLFLAPRRLLQLAPRWTSWGQAWTAYEAFGGYMHGMLDIARKKAAGTAAAAGEFDNDEEKEEVEENLMTVLIDAENAGEDENSGREMTPSEVLGNAFIFLFAGHETTANTTHYALLLLALHQDIQDLVLAEIDSVYERARAEGREELVYEIDFGRFKWLLAVMYETLRVYSPTGITNKWTTTTQPLVFNGTTYAIPERTRVSINGTGIHTNPSVWGPDATEFVPSRWIVDEQRAGSGANTPSSGLPISQTLTIDNFEWVERGQTRSAQKNMLAPTPTYPTPPRVSGSSTTNDFSASTTPSPSSHTPTLGSPILKPPKGSFLPFSEGARACSGKKFATVEFVAVLCALLRSRRIVLDLDKGNGKGQAGWDVERVKRVLAGRKAGALTLQTPEPVPVVFRTR